MFCSNTPSNKPFHRLLDERGSAVVLVISVGALVTLLVFTWIAFSVIRSHKSLSAGNILRARYAAESVISKAVFRQMTGSFGEEKLVVNADDAKPASRNAAVIDAADQGNTVTYTDSLHHSSGEALVTDEGSFLRVQASGTAGKTRCAVDARFGREVSDAFRFALILSEQNRQLEIRRGAVIGDVQLAQRPLGAVSGNVETGIAALPPVNRGKFSMALRELQDMLHASADTVMQGSQVFDVNHWLSVTAGKSLFVNGNVLVQGATRGARNARTITGPWTLIASGDIQISGSVNLDNVGIFSLGTVKCFDNVRLSEVTVYAKNTIDLEDPLQTEFPGAVFVVRVRAAQIFPNCPRYLHPVHGMEYSEHAPRADYNPPAAGWKRFEVFRDALQARDRIDDEPSS